MNLCNELATRTGASRVSLGWVKGDNIKVKALSHTEQFDKKQELIVQLQRVMEECLDQDELVQFDPDGKSSENVTREAPALSRTQGGHAVLSLPLRRKAEIDRRRHAGVPAAPEAAARRWRNGAGGRRRPARPAALRPLPERPLADHQGRASSRERGEEGASARKHMLAKLIIVGVVAIARRLQLGAVRRPAADVPGQAPFQFVPRKQVGRRPRSRGIIDRSANVKRRHRSRPGMRGQEGRRSCVKLDTRELTASWRRPTAQAGQRRGPAGSEADKADRGRRIAQARARAGAGRGRPVSTTRSTRPRSRSPVRRRGPQRRPGGQGQRPGEGGRRADGGRADQRR